MDEIEPISDHEIWSRWLVRRAWLPYLAIEFTATHWPDVPVGIPGTGIPWDKLWHFLAYLGAGALVAFSVGRHERGRVRPKVLLSIAVMLAVYALFDEGTQPLVGRDSEWLDWGVDLLGIALGMLAVTPWASVFTLYAREQNEDSSSSQDSLIRPSATFSRREKASTTTVHKD